VSGGYRTYIFTDSGTITFNGSGTANFVTASTSSTTGALVVTGGVGVGGNLYVGGTIYRNGIAVGYGYTGSAGTGGGGTGTGYTGSIGPIGYTGSTGTQGVIGYTGSAGANGVAGGITYSVVNAGASSYTIAGSASNPTLKLIKGFTYYFTVSATGHPFWIKTSSVTGTSSAYSSGVTNNGVDAGTVTFTVPFDAPATLYYICQFHSSMAGTINVLDSPAGFTGSAGTGYTGSAGTGGSGTGTGYTGSIGPIGYTGSAGTGGGGGSGGVSVGTTAPVSPTEGALWYISDIGVLAMYINTGNGYSWLDIAGKYIVDLSLYNASLNPFVGLFEELSPLLFITLTD
jgi:hypothetical protein